MKKKSDGSNVIYNSQNLICYSSYFSLKQHGTIHLNISKSSSRSWRQLTYFHLSLPFSQWNKSATWSTLCRKWVPGTTSPQQPPSEKPSFANVTNEKKREGGSWVSPADVGYTNVELWVQGASELSDLSEL